MNTRSPRQKIALVISLLVLIFIIVPVVIIATIQYSTNKFAYSKPNQIPRMDVAIVFGALVRPDGTLSPILEDRVDGAVQLYKTGRVRKILMTGDNGSVNYDEVTAMKEYAIKQGIPGEDIYLDYAGFSTYDSCYRAKEIFTLTEAVLVTQRYHLYRALYTCNKLGVSVVGFALPDFELYPDLRLIYSVREYAADLKAWTQLYITHPTARVLGVPEPIISNQ